jgi:hypothetical protein
MSLRGTPSLTPFGAPKAPPRNRFHGGRSSVCWPLALYLTWASGLSIAYFSMPGRTLLLWASLGLSSVLALVIGIRRYRARTAAALVGVTLNTGVLVCPPG